MPNVATLMEALGGKVLTPRTRKLTWAIEKKCYAQRRAYGLDGLDPKTFRYASRRPDGTAVRMRLRNWHSSGAGSATGGSMSCCGEREPS
ncbi:hypothetical protein EN817_27530 [Mesorhizobium sp. M3A.F.Ca.ET.174.01.1.1]|nr:hypothetical protein EN818_28720 [Mesorhizobium sp. M3A.F.Ca.ET.175.01.1.1]TGT22322.1 hypothetical protein EN817_27530 [Mesorhizobium sp. M3A.F.Ca.ET.174.01.1.1]